MAATRKNVGWACALGGAAGAACLLGEMSACGSKSPGVGAGDDASVGSPSRDDGGDGGTVIFASPDTGGQFARGDGSITMIVADAGEGLCTLGSAGSFATQANLNLFGQIVYYNGGAPLPAGHYRIQYVDGCMKYGPEYGWMCNGISGSAFYLVNGDASTDQVVICPGTSWGGFLSTVGEFDEFDACVAANKAVAPTDFYFDGGPLGIALTDFPYDDNVAGENGRNPKWSLTLLEKCPPNVVEVPIPK